MKSRDKGGVADERLNVYGVENLKVAGTKNYRFQKVTLILELEIQI
jgi:hypothetical protein